MTEAQAKRTRLKVWRDVLIALGGSPAFNDTWYQLIRKLAVVTGVSVPCCSQIPLRRLLELMLLEYGDTTGRNAAIYTLERKLAIAMGDIIPCCNNPPLQDLFDNEIPPVPPEGWMFGDPDAPFVFGDPSAGTAFGRP